MPAEVPDHELQGDYKIQGDLEVAGVIYATNGIDGMEGGGGGGGLVRGSFVRVGKVTAQSMTDGQSLTWDADLSDTNGLHAANSAQLVADVDGTWRAEAYLRISGSPTNAQFGWKCSNAAYTGFYGRFPKRVTTDDLALCVYEFDLLAGDYVWVYHASAGGTTDVLGDNGDGSEYTWGLFEQVG